MKNFIIILLSTVFLAGGLYADCDWENDFDDHSFCLEERKYDFDDNCIYIYSREYDGEYIKITKKNDLYVNGKPIKTSYFDRRILSKYYQGMEEIRERAIDIGCDGAQLGLKGAMVGIKAIANLHLVFFGETEEYERKIEEEAAEIEREAETLEKRGEEIEKIADDIEQYEYDLKDRIDELDELGWF